MTRNIPPSPDHQPHKAPAPRHSGRGGTTKQAVGVFALTCGLGLAAAAVAQVFDPAGATTELISINNLGEQGDLFSSQPAVNADGRFVAFRSNAANLIPGGDANGNDSDVFIRDRNAQVTELVSVNSDGIQADSTSFDPSISADGSLVAFSSNATNLAPASPTNLVRNIYLRNRAAGTTEILSISTTGGPGNSASFNPVISADGRFVAYYTWATNLVPGGDANGSANDVLVYDRTTGATELVSVNSAGVQANGSSSNPSISADGRFVAFYSSATNLAPGGDTNGSVFDVFVRDRLSGTTEVVSVDSFGIQGDDSSFGTAISADGRFVTFYSRASNLPGGTADFRTQAYVHDRQTGETELVSQDDFGVPGNDSSLASSVSADGRFVTFFSRADNLIPGGDANGASAADMYVRDRLNGITELVSVNDLGEQANAESGFFIGRSMSSDGRFVAFSSRATNLVAGGDTNGSIDDVFLRDRGAANLPPVADAGPDRMVACVDPTATPVMLDGSASSDPDGDPLG